MKVRSEFAAGILGSFGCIQAFGAGLAPAATPAWIAPANVPECQVTPPTDTSARAAVAAADAKLKCTQALKILATAKASAAPDASQAVAAVAALDQQQKQDEKAKADADARLSFLGFNWGFGVGYGFGKGVRRIADAEIVNGVVRIKDDVTNSPRVLVEVHHFFEGKNGTFGWGPFGSAQVSSDSKSAVAFGLGLMVGWKDPGADSNGSWNLGVGYEYAGSIKVLGDGITANQPLPSGETQVRFKNRSAGAVIVMISRRFRTGAPQ